MVERGKDGIYNYKERTKGMGWQWTERKERGKDDKWETELRLRNDSLETTRSTATGPSGPPGRIRSDNVADPEKVKERRGCRTSGRFHLGGWASPARDPAWKVASAHRASKMSTAGHLDRDFFTSGEPKKVQIHFIFS